MSLTSKITVGSELLDEIERVSAKRERWKRYQYYDQPRMDGSQANFQPAILLMTIAIENAKKAIIDEDAVMSITALKALRDFDSQD